MNEQATRPTAGTTARDDFSGREIARTAETAVSAAAAQAQSQVQAMYLMAMKNPRDMMQVRERLLADCKRRGFAEAARYTLPRGGKKISGPSIRFAEASARALRNLHVRTTIVYDDDERRVGEVTVIDLEANLPLSSSFSIDKTVERKKLRGGEIVMGERVNSSGETTYRILGTEADIQQKQEAMVSRIRRNLILQLLPGDIKDEALLACTETLRSSDEADPAAAAKKLADAFAQIGVSVAQLRDYLGHNVDLVSPDEADELRGLFSALKDGETNWTQVMESRSSNGGDTGEQDKTVRQALLKTLAEARLRDRPRYDAAVTAAGANPGVSAATLPGEALEQIAANLDADPEPARVPGQEG